MNEAMSGTVNQDIADRATAQPAAMQVRKLGQAKGLSLRSLWYGSGLYQTYLGFQRPKSLNPAAGDPWPGDPERGDALFHGRYQFAGQSYAFTNAIDWLPEDASEAWVESCHGFSWLRDFRASGGEMARQHARAAVEDWCDRFGRWHPTTWRPDICGVRLGSWAASAGFLLQGAKPTFENVFLATFGRQARHLNNVGFAHLAGSGRFSALRGQLVCAACLNWSEARIDRIEHD